MRRTIRALLLGGTMLVSGGWSGCATAGGGKAPERLAGHYRYGFEMEAFRPCGGTEEWWIARSDELRTRAEVLPPVGASIYVVIRARVSPEGTYGHLGAYRRQLSVVEVLEVRAATDADCR